MILQYHIPIASLSPSPSLQHNPRHVLHWFYYFALSKPYLKPSHSNLSSSNIKITKTYGQTRYHIFLHSSQFSPLYSPLLVHKTILTIPNNTLFLYTSAIFYLPVFACITAIPTIYNKSIFPTSAI